MVKTFLAERAEVMRDARADLANELVGALHRLQDFRFDPAVVVDALRPVGRLLDELAVVVRSSTRRGNACAPRETTSGISSVSALPKSARASLRWRREARQLRREDEDAHDQREADRLKQIELHAVSSGILPPSRPISSRIACSSMASSRRWCASPLIFGARSSSAGARRASWNARRDALRAPRTHAAPRSPHRTRWRWRQRH